MKIHSLPQGARILLRMPNWMGDVVLCTPSLGALKRARPDLRLTALVKRSVLPAVSGLSLLEDVIVLEGTGWSATRRTAAALRSFAFDAALLFPKGFREALLAGWAGIPVRTGLATDHRSLLLTHPVPFGTEEWNLHHAEQFSLVLSPLGIRLEGDPLLFPLSNEDRSAAARLMTEKTLEEERYVVFHITASKNPRAWHPDRFAAVARALHQERGLRPVLLGTPSERPVLDRFLESCPEAVDTAGHTTLKTMAALAGQSALFVGNDSGPMHIAAAAGASVVALFGPGAPHKTAPFVGPERVRVVYSGLSCSPCRQSFFKDCDPSPEGKPPCIEAITVQEVLAACRDLLG